MAEHSSLFVPGRRVILTVSGVLLVLQLIIEYAFFRNDGVLLIATACQNEIIWITPLHCSLSWQVGILGTSAHCLAQILSMIRYRSLKGYWWHGVLPVISIAGAALAWMSIPLLYVEISR